MARRPIRCCDCLHARVRLAKGEAEAYCRLGHGAPHRAYLVTRGRYPKSFRQAKTCPGYSPAEDEPYVD